MTSEEYRAKTEIKNAAEAAGYLLALRLSFAAYVLSAVLLAASIFYEWSGLIRLLALSVEILAVLSLTYLAITVLYKVRESLITILIVVIVPLAWFWGYFK